MYVNYRYIHPSPVLRCIMYGAATYIIYYVGAY
jgi:hypothetical protein